MVALEQSLARAGVRHLRTRVMVLTGGGALLKDILTVCRWKITGIPVVVAEDPTCVARGGGKALELIDMQWWRSVPLRMRPKAGRAPFFWTTMKPIFGRGPSLQLRLFLAVIISVAAIVAGFPLWCVCARPRLSEFLWSARCSTSPMRLVPCSTPCRPSRYRPDPADRADLEAAGNASSAHPALRACSMDQLEHENQRLARAAGSPGAEGVPQDGWPLSFVGGIPDPSAIRC